MYKGTGILFLNSNPYCVWKGKGMHTYTSSFWVMQVDDLRLKLTEIPSKDNILESGLNS